MQTITLRDFYAPKLGSIEIWTLYCLRLFTPFQIIDVLVPVLLTEITPAHPRYYKNLTTSLSNFWKAPPPPTMDGNFTLSMNTVLEFSTSWKRNVCHVTITPSSPHCYRLYILEYNLQIQKCKDWSADYLLLSCLIQGLDTSQYICIHTKNVNNIHNLSSL